MNEFQQYVSYNYNNSVRCKRAVRFICELCCAVLCSLADIRLSRMASRRRRLYMPGIAFRFLFRSMKSSSLYLSSIRRSPTILDDGGIPRD